MPFKDKKNPEHIVISIFEYNLLFSSTDILQFKRSLTRRYIHIQEYWHELTSVIPKDPALHYSSEYVQVTVPSLESTNASTFLEL